MGKSAYYPQPNGRTGWKFVINKTKMISTAFKTIVIDEIPKNESGKTLYQELKKFYQ